MSDLDRPARPWSKEQQTARGERRRKRNVASRKDWQRIANAKRGPCRSCGRQGSNQLAHLISRGQLGPDETWNIVSLCMVCHGRFDARDPETCLRVAESLTDDELFGLIAFGGEAVIERRFGVVYKRP